MKILELYDNRSNLAEAVEQCVQFLEKGKLIVYPTDTIYGIGCDAYNLEAIQRLKNLKARPGQKPFSVIMRDIEMIKDYALLDNKKEKLLKKILPGKFTAILKSKQKLPPEINASGETLGIRIPDYDLTRKISNKFLKPYITTSVNISGEKPENWGVEIIEKYKIRALQPDLVIDAGKLNPEATEPVASTVIDLTQDQPRILRRGDISPKEIFELFK